MVEFGEKLKQVREEKGITQQTLADHLFVTRQAVSRWEGGSRYPDLMTAKKISKFLEISLDELLADDDMALYAEKNPVLESPVSKGIQTVIMSFAFICYLIRFIWTIYYGWREKAFGPDVNFTIEGYGGIGDIFLMITLGYAIVMSVRDRMTPKISGVISTAFFGGNLLMSILISTSKPYGWHILLLQATVIDLTLLIITLRYFWGKKLYSPIPMYCFSVLCLATDLYGSFFTMKYATDPNINSQAFATVLVNRFAEIMILGLLCYMEHVLYKKRKRRGCKKTPLTEKQL